ncbi:MAG: hypothetical protein J3Q66DRAFT_415039 [Benniella sp.]|nr:MAG: hypothetical protein J3Q66DRAFT_415039 [Benniella sp.]
MSSINCQSNLIRKEDPPEQVAYCFPVRCLKVGAHHRVWTFTFALVVAESPGKPPAAPLGAANRLRLPKATMDQDFPVLNNESSTSAAMDGFSSHSQDSSARQNAKKEAHSAYLDLELCNCDDSKEGNGQRTIRQYLQHDEASLVPTSSKAQETAKTMDILETESGLSVSVPPLLFCVSHPGSGNSSLLASKIEMLHNVNQYRQAKGLDRRSMSFLLAKLALVDKASNGAQLLPDSLNTEAFQTVEVSSHSADYELRQVAQERKLEQDQLEISIKEVKYLEAREAELLRRKTEDESLLQKLQEIEQLEEALCESQRSYKTHI